MKDKLIGSIGVVLFSSIFISTGFIYKANDVKKKRKIEAKGMSREQMEDLVAIPPSEQNFEYIFDN
jgi:hypothetical protein